MEIYDYADLGDMRSWDYSMNNRTPKDDGIDPIFITDKEIEVGQILIIDNTAYIVCTMSGKGNKYYIAYVEKTKNQLVFVNGEEPKEHNYEDNLICPYCGYEDSDSWELDDEEDEHVCGSCGSTFAYQRIITTHYFSQPVKKADITLLD